MNTLNLQQLPQYIDHTLLRKEATEAEILQACSEALEYGFKGLCIEARWLPLVAPKLKGSKTLAVTVIAFPHGNSSTESKVEEAKKAVRDGAQEVDMVLNRDWMKEKNYSLVLKDVQQVVAAVTNIPVKVILETSELTDAEKAIACALCKLAGAKFVKTSTGFSKSGATAADVALMRSAVGPEMGVKASGGVRSYEDAVKMIQAGATRLGTSAGVAILQGAKGERSY
jgi:deoxyribose-phosphate aldolase